MHVFWQLTGTACYVHCHSIITNKKAWNGCQGCLVENGCIGCQGCLGEYGYGACLFLFGDFCRFKLAEYQVILNSDTRSSYLPKLGF